MQKTILITGATDGIGLLTAQKLFSEGHQVLLHGRNEAKLTEAAKQLGGAPAYLADLSSGSAVEALADAVCENHPQIDVLRDMHDRMVRKGGYITIMASWPVPTCPICQAPPRRCGNSISGICLVS